MKYLLKKIGLIIIGFSIVFMLGNCGGGGEKGESEKAEETANKKSTTSKDAEKSTETETKSYKLEEGYYYKFGTYLQMPVIANYTDIYEKLGVRTKDNKGEIERYIQLIIKFENIEINGNKFSGTFEKGPAPINNDNWDSWEGKEHFKGKIIWHCTGELSKDHKMIKYLELEDLWLSHYGNKSDSYELEKRRSFVILENIPVLHDYKQDTMCKKFQFKHKPTCEIYGGIYFLPEAREIISSITEADFIHYKAKRDLRKNRAGNILLDDWQERDENILKVNLEKIAKLSDGMSYTFTFQQMKKIVDKEKAKEIIKHENEELIEETKEETKEEAKGDRIHMEKTTFTSGEIMQIGAEYKFRRNPVYGDAINEIYIGFLPKNTPLDFLFENAFENKKYVVTKNELDTYKKDTLFTSKTFFQFKAPQSSTNALTGEQAEIDYYDVIMFSIDPSGKKILEIARKAIIVTKKEEKGFIKILGDNNTYKPGENIKVIYHENIPAKEKVTDMWVGILEQNIEPELTPSKSDFMSTKNITKRQNEILHFKAPDEPGLYKFLLYKEIIPVPLGVVNFEVIENSKPK